MRTRTLPDAKLEIFKIFPNLVFFSSYKFFVTISAFLSKSKDAIAEIVPGTPYVNAKFELVEAPTPTTKSLI